VQYLIEKADIDYLEKIETLAKQYFEVVTFQTMKFFMIEMYAAIPNSQEYKQWNEVVSEYLVWQSNHMPFDLLLLVRGYQHSHDNDLTWNQCEKVCLEYHSLYEEKKECADYIMSQEDFDKLFSEPEVSQERLNEITNILKEFGVSNAE